MIKIGKVEDSLGIARVLVTAWKSAYTGIIHSDYPETLRVDFFKKIMDRNITENLEVIFVYKLKNRVCGFISLRLGDNPEVIGLYVLPDLQGDGIGRALLSRVKDYLYSKGYRSFSLWTLKGAKNNGFYSNNQGVVVEEKKLEIGSNSYDGICFSFDISNYNCHEEVYKLLKSRGYKGWGGETFETRYIGWEENVQRVVSYLKGSRGNLLELGSGTGDRCFLFEKEGFNVTGYEISETAVNWAKEKAKDQNSNASFRNIDLGSEELGRDTQFDVIIDGNCVHCILKDRRPLFFNNIRNLLKDDGILYISSITHESISGDVLDRRISPVPRYFTSRSNLVKELEGYGFKVIESWFANRKCNDHFAGILGKA